MPYTLVPTSSFSLQSIASAGGQLLRFSFALTFEALPGSSSIMMVQAVDAAGNPQPHAAPALAVQLRVKARKLNLFLVQSQAPLPESKLQELAAEGSSTVVLTWDTPYSEQGRLLHIADTVYYPNSTLTEGRNKLFEHAYSDMFLATQQHFFECAPAEHHTAFVL